MGHLAAARARSWGGTCLTVSWACHWLGGGRGSFSSLSPSSPSARQFQLSFRHAAGLLILSRNVRHNLFAVVESQQ
jgi:hypothetical protein